MIIAITECLLVYALGGRGGEGKSDLVTFLCTLARYSDFIARLKKRTHSRDVIVSPRRIRSPPKKDNRPIQTPSNLYHLCTVLGTMSVRQVHLWSA